GRRSTPRARSGHVSRAAVRSAPGRDGRRHGGARRRAGAGLPTDVPEADGAAPRRARRAARGCVRERVLARRLHERSLRADRFGALLLHGQRNRFHDASAPDRLSGEAHSFIAGVLAHLPGLCGLTAPSFNSYHRILPQYWAGAFVCWGHDNREAPVGVPSVFWGMEEASTNAELKAADASANPYLAVGGLIA